MSGVAKSMEAAWLAAGMHLWPHTYRDHHDDDASVLRMIGSAVASEREMITAYHMDAAPENIALWWATIDGVWCAKWVDGGARTIHCDDRYAAAMACTRTPNDALGELHAPWPAFLLRLPPGLLPSGNGNGYLSHIRCLQLEHPRKAFLEMFESSNMRAISQECLHNTIVDSLFDGRELDEVDARSGDHPSYGAVFQRSAALAKRIAIGCLYSMQYTNNFSNSTKNGDGRAKAARHGPPPHRTIVIGRAMSVDLRATVTAAAHHGASTPAYQTLVRGHLKRQVIGLGRTGRKVIWIEPYWRGPEDAPILARPYRVGPSDKPGDAR